MFNLIQITNSSLKKFIKSQTKLTFVNEVFIRLTSLGVMRTKAGLEAPQFHSQLCKHMQTETLVGIVNTIQTTIVSRMMDKGLQESRKNELNAICEKYKIHNPLGRMNLPINAHPQLQYPKPKL